VLDRLHAEAHAPLALDGLFGWACYLLLGLAACALVARVQSRATNTRALLVAVLSVAPFVLILFWLIGDVPAVRSRPLLMTAAALVYLACLAVRVLGAAFGFARLRPALLAVALLIVSPWVLASLSLDTRLWVAQDAADSQSDEDSAQTEVLFYDQPARIAAAVERVRASERGKTSVYFLGFAGDGDPAVFRREAQFASEVFGRRFGTEARSLLLINDIEDRDSYPLASVSALGQALKALATRMDPDNDVLVLFLTSHGSQDGLEVQNGSLPLAQLAPADLHEALETAGIRWPLIVISACYAGVFVDELKGETTAIVTAADADHTSFGCEEDRDLTWFGEAFLKDALPNSTTLEDAFRKASALIAQREDADHQSHSNPQLYVGAAMKRKLAALEAARPAQDRHSFTVRR
jgi:Peptidase C13 family